MRGLLKVLSPFAPDQSGATAVFYDMGCITVICDAGGCTGNICGFDEPRWQKSARPIFSAGLRDMDAILGRDDRLIAKLAKVAKKSDADFAAIIGTPVPAVIATDFRALKRMAEKKCGMPIVTCECQGTELYDVGEQEAYMELAKTFVSDELSEAATPAGVACGENLLDSGFSLKTCQPETPAGVACGENGIVDNRSKASDIAANRDESQGTAQNHECPRILGIIGATPLNLSNISADENLREYYKAQGYDEVYCYGMGAGLEELKKAGLAEKNIVIASSGFKMARYLERKFGTPFEAAFPIVPATLAARLRDNSAAIQNAKVCVIHQQVAAESIRQELEKRGNEVTVASFFKMDKSLRRDCDVRLETEEDYQKLIEEGNFDYIICDELMKRAVPSDCYKEWIPFTHFAVSGNLEENLCAL